MMRNGGDLALLDGVDPRHPLAGAGVLDLAAGVPGQLGDIQRVVEDAGAAINLPPDRGVAPEPAAGSGNALCIQGGGDLPRCHAGGVISENPLDDRGLGRVDLAVAGILGASLGREDGVAIGEATWALALTHPPGQAAAGLLPDVGQLHLTHHAHHANMHLCDQTEAGGMDLDLVEGQLIEQPGDVGEVAAVRSMASHTTTSKRRALASARSRWNPGRKALEPLVAGSA